MKCMNKKVKAYKYKLQQEAEEARWNSLTPEEQEKELKELTKAFEKGKKAMSDLAIINNYINFGHTNW